MGRKSRFRDIKMPHNVGSNAECCNNLGPFISTTTVATLSDDNSSEIVKSACGAVQITSKAGKALFAGSGVIADGAGGNPMNAAIIGSIAPTHPVARALLVDIVKKHVNPALRLREDICAAATAEHYALALTQQLEHLICKNGLWTRDDLEVYEDLAMANAVKYNKMSDAYVKTVEQFLDNVIEITEKSGTSEHVLDELREHATEATSIIRICGDATAAIEKFSSLALAVAKSMQPIVAPDALALLSVNSGYLIHIKTFERDLNMLLKTDQTHMPVIQTLKSNVQLTHLGTFVTKTNAGSTELTSDDTFGVNGGESTSQVHLSADCALVGDTMTAGAIFAPETLTVDALVTQAFKD